MNFVILAAGKGIRANSHERNIPKVLLKSNNNKSLLVHLLENINKYSKSKNVNIVVGFLHEKIINEVLSTQVNDHLNIEFIYNDYYEKGVITSLYQGMKAINGEITILNGDTFYSKEVFIALNKVEKSTLLVMPKEDIKDSVKVLTKGEQIIDIGKKLQSYSFISTGCLFLEKKHTMKSTQILKSIIDESKKTTMIWHNLIKLLISSNEKIAYRVLNKGAIFEIDTQNDYEEFIELIK